MVEYPLFTFPNGGVEQRCEDWWQAVCTGTRVALAHSGLAAKDIAGISFSSQMQGFVPVDDEGKPLRNPMIYLDCRATEQIRRSLGRGLVHFKGWNVHLALLSLWLTGGIAGTPKDPLWKYHWFAEHEPHLFARLYKWLDVKDYLILHCTGRFGMTHDSANVTWLFDTRPDHLSWSKKLCQAFSVNPGHLPKVVGATDVIGGLTEQAANELGLCSGIPVFGGGGDAPLTAIGAGCVERNDTHIYVGTSGWVAATVDTRMTDARNFIASICGAIPNRYLYVAEQETSGLCLQWVRDHLARDEIGIYLDKTGGELSRDDNDQLYELLNAVVSANSPGAGGILFTPWLYGNRSPREDQFARGMFFNIGFETGKGQMVRAVLEGVAFHKRWMLEALERKVACGERVRFVGGGAKSAVWCQIMADITGRTIETIVNGQNAGTMGAAIVCGVGLGIIPSFSTAKELVSVDKTYLPRKEYANMYNRQFDVFKALYARNRKLFRRLNDVESMVDG